MQSPPTRAGWSLSPPAPLAWRLAIGTALVAVGAYRLLDLLGAVLVGGKPQHALGGRGRRRANHLSRAGRTSGHAG